MTYRRILLTAMVAGLLPAAAALAQTTNPAYPTNPPANSAAPMATTAPAGQMPATVTGKVISSTSVETVVETDSGQRLSLATDTATSMPTLSTGDRVNVRYSTTLNGSYHAENISLSTTTPSDHTISTPPVAVVTTTPRAPVKTSLPKTAGSLPLVTLIGALAGLGAAALHRKDA